MFICGFLAFCITPSNAAPISLTDDLGRKVELKGPAERIVALAPFLTEIAFAVGALAGRDASAAALAFEQELRKVREEYSGRRRLTAFLEIWNRPLTTIAGRHYMNEALEACGAVNVFADLEGVAPVVEWEEVYRRDPEVVIGVASAAGEEEFRANWRVRATLAAVKNDRLVFVDADALQRPTPRTPQAIRGLCGRLDRYR